MSDPALFSILDVTELHAELGGAPFRLYLAGHAEQSAPRPYVTYQMISEVEDGTLTNKACSARYTVRIDVWADNPNISRRISATIKRLLRPHAYATFRFEDYDSQTKLFRDSRTFDFMINPN